MVKVEVNIMMLFYGGSLTAIISLYIKRYKDNNIEIIDERNVLYKRVESEEMNIINGEDKEDNDNEKYNIS